MQTVTKLKQIRRALVSPTSSSRGSYAIDVFTPSQSATRIPTSHKAASKGQRPDAHIDKQFADFVALRDELGTHSAPRRCATWLGADAGALTKPANQGGAALHRRPVVACCDVPHHRVGRLPVPEEPPATTLRVPLRAAGPVSLRPPTRVDLSIPIGDRLRTRPPFM
ncbi:hypothetical protein ON010_g10926 [Phytophthora cinnamomi]|nr:hypothetical protein ON010_g10926 [Phytophthora cinnamomi]